ncbi:uncharacterized protein LOC105381981 [Plutella xylostella]|uniref:uncharacterized protein LOC105381981 n=1 Tax=Plutella xylostella TaxID=51655 RepID=UPI002032DAF7|nr:uncharacterized protein LOC105381981 [Plutella xylostella]
MTTFGEIVEPTSRTAWEDWDDIENRIDSHISKLAWEKDVPVPGQIENLFILEGNYLSECVKSQTHLKLQLIDSIPEVNLNIFNAVGTFNYFVTVKYYNLVLSSEIVECLKGYLKVARNVVALQTKPLPEFQTSVLTNQDCIIRTLSTTLPVSIDIKYPKLEQPNIISGISAGVLSLREHLDMSCVAIICFVEQLEEVHEVKTLLEKFNIVRNVNTKPANVLDSNLYI